MLDERRADELEDVVSVAEGVHHLFDHLVLVELRVQLLTRRVSLSVLHEGSLHVDFLGANLKANHSIIGV